MTDTQIYNPRLPWDNLPKLPPDVDVETSAILKACIKARDALIKVVAASRKLPDQSILVHAISLQEARSSSEIENIVTTNDSLYQAIATNGSSADPNAKEVLRYREAIWKGIEELKQQPVLNVSLFETLCSCIKDKEFHVRNQTVYLGNPHLKQIHYTPPADSNRIRALLANLEKFLTDENDLEVLVKLAISHYQFEAIHPFIDGNGRTGRILNILYLMNQGLLESPIIYLSRFFLENRGYYYKYLREVTENNSWHQWIFFILEAIEQSSKYTVTKIEAMENLFNDMTKQARLHKTNAARREGFMPLLFKLPYCTIDIVQQNLECSYLTARKYLQEMTALSLLTKVKKGRRTFYVNQRLVELLNEEADYHH